MSFAVLLNQDVELLRRGTAEPDEWGNEQPTWESVGTYRARLEHTTSQEIPYAGGTVVTDWQIFMHASADIAAADRVEVDDRKFEVIGEPAKVYGRARSHHIQARLRAIGGA